MGVVPPTAAQGRLLLGLLVRPRIVGTWQVSPLCVVRGWERLGPVVTCSVFQPVRFPAVEWA